ncbi:MAG: DUF929 family protein [Candidatus Lutacidiplasmatales archaeon]
MTGLIVLGALWAGGILSINPGAPSPGPAGLTNVSRAEPGNGWVGYSNPVWTSSNKPVVFSYGSIACPYCAASSWPLREALKAFGIFFDSGYSTSSSFDVYPNTPGTTLGNSTFNGNSLSWDPKEATDPSTITLPALSPLEQTYVHVYDPIAEIPFLVIGGVYAHGGTLVNPSILSGFTPYQVSNIMAGLETNATVYGAIHSAATYIEAFMEKACELAGTPVPAAVSSDSSVQAIFNSIT